MLQMHTEPVRPQRHQAAFQQGAPLPTIWRRIDPHHVPGSRATSAICAVWLLSLASLGAAHALCMNKEADPKMPIKSVNTQIRCQMPS